MLESEIPCRKCFFASIISPFSSVIEENHKLDFSFTSAQYTALGDAYYSSWTYDSLSHHCTGSTGLIEKLIQFNWTSIVTRYESVPWLTFEWGIWLASFYWILWLQPLSLCYGKYAATETLISLLYLIVGFWIHATSTLHLVQYSLSSDITVRLLPTLIWITVYCFFNRYSQFFSVVFDRMSYRKGNLSA